VNKQQQAQALLTRFIKGFESRYDWSPVINRYKSKWGMVDVIDSIGYPRAVELVDYYFKCEADHTVEGFFNTFDSLDKMQKDQEADAKKRARLRAETRERMNEVESRSNGNRSGLR
jgi:hypothetical protein